MTLVSRITQALWQLWRKKVDFDPTQAGNIDGKNIGVQRATLSSQWLEANYPKANIKQYGAADEAFLDLTSGRLDAIFRKIRRGDMA
ncbi:MAG: transporter substrate-binding domain-containing protein [Moraxella sp.]|nr:transporter substrate-binding domain-containing protein [Moraxella sp.]